MSAKKPPAQLRLTFIKQKEAVENGDGGWLYKEVTKLGFAVAYEPNSRAYAKREKTQNDWAYRPSAVVGVGGLWYYSEYNWDTKIAALTLVPEYLQPIIIDNTELEGFKIVTSISRYSTSNKLWRILDPRGFELEITTACLEEIILTGGIDRGVIIGPCIWRTPKQLVRVT